MGKDATRVSCSFAPTNGREDGKLLADLFNRHILGHLSQGLDGEFLI
jgi:hypothetical protein